MFLVKWRGQWGSRGRLGASVETHCLFDSSGALCLTRTRVLKAEPEEDIGDD